MLTRARLATLPSALADFFGPRVQAGDRLLVAFSGGTDSTALLWGLSQLAPTLEITVHAAHLDHRLDSDSGRRARDARRLAVGLGAEWTLERLATDSRPRGEGDEAFARQHRYAFLEQLAEELGARFIVTAHHADDQAETVLLRLLYGSGLEGLGAMRPTRGRHVRPLLGLRRTDLHAAVAAAGLEPVEDPTNRDLAVPRNAVRSHLLPRLAQDDQHVADSLCRLATAAQHANRELEKWLTRRLRPRPLGHARLGQRRGATLDRRALTALPDAFWPPALALLHRVAGVFYPASSAARNELLRQLKSGGTVGCDCGRGWRWEADTEALRLVRDASSVGHFTYNLRAPGSVVVSELDLRVRLTRGKVAPWMFRGRPDRAGLSIRHLEQKRLQVRNRSPGDRIRPLGNSGHRRLKDLLIDHQIPRQERDRLPLLVIDDQIAWVPSVTIDDQFRISDESSVWIAEIEHLETCENPPPAESKLAAREKGSSS